jgi:hypothetical protein
LKHVTSRSDIFVKELLKFDSGDEENREVLLRQLHEKIVKFDFVRTSKELDYLYQLVLVFASRFFQYHFGTTCSTALAVFDDKDNTMYIRPSFYGPGKCSTDRSPIPLNDEKCGLTGTAAKHNRLVLCTQMAEACPIHIAFNVAGKKAPSHASFNLPINRETRSEIIKRHIPTLEPPFAAAAHPPQSLCPSASTLCNFDPEIPDTPEPCADKLTAVLNIESSDNGYKVDPNSFAKDCCAFLKDSQTQDILQALGERISDARAERPQYVIFRTLNTICQLAQHNLRPREAYVSILHEISALCHGADVTLHLRDLFNKSDNDRCLRLITGVGRNFRGYLINERYGLGQGLVGTTTADAIDAAKKTAAERERVFHIWSAKDPADSSVANYKQLMVSTVLNVTIPLWFHDLPIGVLNIEWDNESFEKISEAQKADLVVATESFSTYFEARRLPLLRRIGGYLSLVVDYFDDLRNPKLERFFEKDANDSMPHPGSALRTLGQVFDFDKGHRILMGYYAKAAFDEIDKAPPAASSGATTAMRPFLQGITDAVGYLIGYQSGARIQVSLREFNTTSRELVLITEPHGLQSFEADKPIPVPTEKTEMSVTANCFSLGAPVLGKIKPAGGTAHSDKRFKKPSRLTTEQWCRKSFNTLYKEKLSDQRMPETMTYLSTVEKESFFEFAAPLVFGPRVRGTLDFDLFTVHKSHKHRARLNYLAILEWARTVTYCLEYAADARSLHDAKLAFSTNSSTDFHSLEACGHFENILRLTRQIVANVRLEPHDIFEVAAGYFSDILPIRDFLLLKPEFQFDPSAPADPNRETISHGNEKHLVFPRHSEVSASTWGNLQRRLSEDSVAKPESQSTADADEAFFNLSYEGDLVSSLFVQRNAASEAVPGRRLSDHFKTGTARAALKVFAGLTTMIAQQYRVDQVHFSDDLDRLRSHFSSVLPGLLSKKAAEATSADNFLTGFFDGVDQVLGQVFAPPDSTDSPQKNDRYLWFLYRKDFDVSAGASILRCGVQTGTTGPKKRWACIASAGGREFAYNIADNLPALVDDSSFDARFKQIMGFSPEAKIAIEIHKPSLIAELNKKTLNRKTTVLNIVTDALAAREYEVPDPSASEPLRSITVRVAQTVVPNSNGEVLAFHDMNVCPYRSSRQTGAFFKEPHAILGIPIVCHGLLLGVLNIIRQRKNHNTDDFFNTDEIKTARTIAALLSMHLESHLAKIDLRVPRTTSVLAKLEATTQKWKKIRVWAGIENEIFKAIPPRTILLVGCDFFDQTLVANFVAKHLTGQSHPVELIENFVEKRNTGLTGRGTVFFVRDDSVGNLERNEALKNIKEMTSGSDSSFVIFCDEDLLESLKADFDNFAVETFHQFATRENRVDFVCDVLSAAGFPPVGDAEVATTSFLGLLSDKCRAIEFSGILREGKYGGKVSRADKMTWAGRRIAAAETVLAIDEGKEV